MSLTVQTKAAAGLILAAVLLLALALAEQRNQRAFVESSKWVTHTHEVLEQLEALRSAMQDAETGQRGYLFTGKEKYLEVYKEALGRVDASESHVRQLTADNPGQQRRLRELAPQIDKKLAMLHAAIQLRKAGGMTADSSIALTDEEMEAMVEIRGAITEMEQQENMLLALRQQAFNARRTTLTFRVFGALALVLLGSIFFVVHKDVLRRRQAEEVARRLNEELELRVSQRTAELETANKEMEAFSYSVSHDLRAPLRHISGFSKILMEDFGPSLPEEAQHYLQRIQVGTHRMGFLVDDLLNLARVGRRTVGLEVAELKPLVEEAIAILQPELAGRDVEWKINNLPRVECDPSLVQQVFQNLIANAIKFTRPRSHAVIEIGQVEGQGDAVVFVRDNGVGFSMKYADKLFGLFQRLHRAEDFEGTGVGLAIVERIIQKHGGRIWAEAELDKGATFYFTLASTAEIDSNTKAKAAAGGEKS